jgi:hypothetical protein
MFEVDREDISISLQNLADQEKVFLLFAYQKNAQGNRSGFCGRCQSITLYWLPSESGGADFTFREKIPKRELDSDTPDVGLRDSIPRLPAQREIRR